MTAKATWIVLAGTLLACAAIVVAIIGFAEKNTPLGIAGAVATVAVVVGIVVLYRQLGNAGRSAFDLAASTDFNADDKGWYHGSGLAIDRHRKVLLVGTSEGVRRVPFDQISGVAYHANRTAPVAAGNSILALITLPMAISAMIHNASKAGLHVAASGQTARIVGIKPRDAERWEDHLRAARGI